MSTSEINLLKECITTLEYAFKKLSGHIQKPQFINEEGKERFEFTNPDPHIFVILKGLRVVSGLNASIALLEKGYIQKVGVLCRSIIEFLNDINFIQDGIDKNQFTQHQQEMINLFFEKDMKNSQEYMQTPNKSAEIPRQKVYAELGRFFNPDNPQRMRQITKTVEEVFSGYTHGAYPNIMELYFSGDFEGFYLNGIQGRIPEGLRYIAGFCIHPALNTFATIAAFFSETETFNMLIQQRN